MKRGFALVLVFLLFASILSISLISANIFGTWFEKSNNSENPENANSNTITGAFSWFRSSAKCGDGKINRAGEQCDGFDNNCDGQVDEVCSNTGTGDNSNGDTGDNTAGD